MNNSDIISKLISDSTLKIDNIFNLLSITLNKYNIDYDEYDIILFSMFRKLIVKWNGISVLLKNKQAENCTILLRSIYELQISLEFIFLENEKEQIHTRVTAYKFNTDFQQIKIYNKFKDSPNLIEQLYKKPIYAKTLPNLRDKYKYHWAKIATDENINNFTELLKYVSSYYFAENNYNKFMNYKYKLFSTEIHSNNLDIKNYKGNFYSSDYTKEEYNYLHEFIIELDTLLWDFISFLIMKYNLKNKSEYNLIFKARNELLYNILNLELTVV